MPKIKIHDCTPKIRKKLIKKDPRLVSVRFDLSNIVTWEQNKVIAKNQTGQRAWLQFKHKKKNGEETIKEEKSFITHSYCPFCGKKYQ